jgi:hypothetical protein
MRWWQILRVGDRLVRMVRQVTSVAAKVSNRGEYAVSRSDGRRVRWSALEAGTG